MKFPYFWPLDALDHVHDVNIRYFSIVCYDNYREKGAKFDDAGVLVDIENTTKPIPLSCAQAKTKKFFFGSFRWMCEENATKLVAFWWPLTQTIQKINVNLIISTKHRAYVVNHCHPSCEGWTNYTFYSQPNIKSVCCIKWMESDLVFFIVRRKPNGKKCQP